MAWFCFPVVQSGAWSIRALNQNQQAPISWNLVPKGFRFNHQCHQNSIEICFLFELLYTFFQIISIAIFNIVQQSSGSRETNHKKDIPKGTPSRMWSNKHVKGTGLILGSAQLDGPFLASKSSHTKVQPESAAIAADVDVTWWYKREVREIKTNYHIENTVDNIDSKKIYSFFWIIGLLPKMVQSPKLFERCHWELMSFEVHPKAMCAIQEQLPPNMFSVVQPIAQTGQ